MSRVSSIEMPGSNTIRPNYSSIHQNDISRMWSMINIGDQLEKIERWGYKIAFNLVLPGDRIKNRPKRVLTVVVINLFLYFFAFKTLFAQILINDNSLKLLLMSGDLSPYFGTAFKRLYLNSLILSWGFHSAFVYSLVSRNSNKAREWIIRFDDNWRHTYFRAPNTEKKIVDNMPRIVDISFKTFKITVVAWVIVCSMVYIYGGLTNFTSFDSTALIYIVWSIVSILWCLISAVVNLTALFHYLILTRAIIIRFTEARFDFEYAIRSKPPAEAWVLSKLFEKHYIVCDMVIGSNQHFKTYLFFFFTIIVTHECFLFYQMFTVNNPLTVKIVIGFYIVFDAIQLLLVSLFSAKITSSAHKPYHVVHGVGKMTLPEDVQVQAQLFVQRLSGGSVGMTILDGFVVTGGVLSSILTGIITYFSIIVEMN